MVWELLIVGIVSSSFLIYFIRCKILMRNFNTHFISMISFFGKLAKICICWVIIYIPNNREGTVYAMISLCIWKFKGCLWNFVFILILEQIPSHWIIFWSFSIILKKFNFFCIVYLNFSNVKNTNFWEPPFFETLLSCFYQQTNCMCIWHN